MRLFDLANLHDDARETILKNFSTVEDERDRDWMIDLLGGLVGRGDGQARGALYTLAEAGNERAQDEIAELDDEGLQWVEANVLPHLALEDRWRIGMWLPDEEADDQTPTQRRLRKIDQENDAAREAARKQRVAPQPQAANFFERLDGKKAPRVSPYEFERLANVRQWRKAARRFLRETDERALWDLANAFKRGGFPLPARSLYRQATHPERGFAVMRVLGTFRSPSVRRLAIGVARRRPLPWNALEAIRSCLRPGDEPLVLQALISVEDEANTTKHNPILDVVGFMRRHPKGRWQPHAEWIVEHSPCSRCRSSAVDWMAEHGTIPASILEEIPFDAEPDIREVAVTARRGTPAPPPLDRSTRTSSPPASAGD